MAEETGKGSADDERIKLIWVVQKRPRDTFPECPCQEWSEGWMDNPHRVAVVGTQEAVPSTVCGRTVPPGTVCRLLRKGGPGPSLWKWELKISCKSSVCQKQKSGLALWWGRSWRCEKGRDETRTKGKREMCGWHLGVSLNVVVVCVFFFSVSVLPFCFIFSFFFFF